MRPVKRTQGGFTLIEMLVVVAIIGALAALLGANLKAQVRSIDVANRVGDIVHEASREAVVFGTVRSDVALALGSKARTRVIAYGSGPVTFALQRLSEHTGDSGADWITVTTYTHSAAVTSVAWAPSVGAYATVSATASTTWGSSASSPSFTAPCYPDGTCDGRTLFFQTVDYDDLNYQARLSVMPLGGATYVRPDWN